MRINIIKRIWKLPLNIENFVAGTYEACEFRLLAFGIIKRGRQRWLHFIFGKYGIGVAFNVRCQCPACKKNFWHRLFFIGAAQ